MSYFQQVIIYQLIRCKTIFKKPKELAIGDKMKFRAAKRWKKFSVIFRELIFNY
jgi:hypothetical protein